MSRPSFEEHSRERQSEPAWSKDELDSALRQGELLSDIIEYRLTWNQGASPDDEVDVILVKHELVLVVSQDCDLRKDYLAARATSSPDDKPKGELRSVLLVEVELAGVARQWGSEDGDNREKITGTIWGEIKKNQSARYQFLEPVSADLDLKGHGVEEMTADFTRVFSCPTEVLYGQLGSTELNAARRSRLLQPYREHLQNRLCAYHARVGLPLDHRSRQEH